MTPLLLVLSLFIVGILVYRFWEPFTNPPKRETPEGTASLYFFYTDWCGHSKKAMPEWEALEAKLAESPMIGNTRVKAVRVNGETDRATTSLYDVHGFPTIKLETSSSLLDYEGKRTSVALLDFLQRTLG
jgi:thiol-disulfide isomerase/thioredoxin